MEARKSRTLLFIRVQRLFPDGFVSYFPRDRRESFCTVCVSFALENAHKTRSCAGSGFIGIFAPQETALVPSPAGNWFVFTAAPVRTG